jgi:hypothetical protein
VIIVCRHQQMNMVGHQYVRMYGDGLLYRRRAKAVEEEPITVLIEEYSRSVDAAKNHVHRKTGGYDSCASGHRLHPLKHPRCAQV